MRMAETPLGERLFVITPIMAPSSRPTVPGLMATSSRHRAQRGALPASPSAGSPFTIMTAFERNPANNGD
ncbi:MAG: hypothetical protein AAFV54_10680 [Pseudomonadota bacterium]